ncbi:MAG TPA: hypothetical protein DCS07_00035 [Bdellovibrionales bacterium]|nr:MAG: hypothetical protein A2X97_09690 [Bdellovibrionales bacterium GWA1_52_35]OFZ41317.1 MAG: hypothetical protein A2070_09005 [Bdellovibrionales bacterium GWC1_52_8]HAR41021.1 hypothetical protein [Bdellovibrionales bacterium]HCM40428.1 hypothetical protein [Bdellovibrionales bacterium]
MIILQHLIEANIEELGELRLQLPRGTALRLYGDILFAYLQGDMVELRKIIAFLVSTNEHPLLLVLAKLRLAIRERKISENLISEILALAEGKTEWLGECYFVAAWAYETMGEHAKAIHHYQIAANELTQMGALRKALKARSNELAAFSCIDMDSKRLITQYNLIYRQARKLREFGIAGTVLNNISREYQRIGAYGVALKFSRRAVGYLKKDLGTLHYEMALVHQAHLLIELGRSREAGEVLSQCDLTTFPEVRAAQQILKNGASPESGALTPTWRDRSRRKISKGLPLLGDLENQLIAALNSGPQDKFALMEALYGCRIDPVARETRFKTLLSRLRAKHPSLIVFEDGLYRLVDVAIKSDVKSRSRRRA